MFYTGDYKDLVAGAFLFIHLIYCCGNELINCKIVSDQAFNGSLVDCSNRNLTFMDLPNLRFLGTTTLDISYNNIGHFPDDAFVRFKDLKCLLCTECNLTKISNYSLRGLDALEVLHLDHNRLSMIIRTRINKPTIPFGVFRYVQMLKELYIDNNGYYHEEVSNYSQFLDIFEHLPKLTNLSIDSFKNLKIGTEFLNFTKLYSLRVHCNSLRSISNNSLQGFKSSHVKIFELLDGSKEQMMYLIELNVFENLPNVSYLSLKQIRVGNQNMLSMLKPLAGRTIDTVRLESVYSPAFGNFKEMVSDTIIMTNDLKYVREINVTNILWYDSEIYSVEPDALSSPLWMKHLKTLLLETNALTQTSVLMFFEAMLLRKIELVGFLWTVSGFRNEFTNYIDSNQLQVDSNLNKMEPRTILNGNKATQYKIDDFSIGRERSISHSNAYNFHHETQVYRHNKDNGEEIENKDSILDRHTSTNEVKDSDHRDIFMWAHDILRKNTSSGAPNNFLKIVNGHLIITAPPKIRTYIFDGGHYLKVNFNVTVTTNQIRTIIFSNTIGILQLHGTVYGLENLTTLNIQGSKNLDLGLKFLHTFSNLRHLTLRKTSLNPHFYHKYSNRIIEKQGLLESLDLADNNLQRLPTNMFLTNKCLKQLYLEKNKLSNIPFSLKLTPVLNLLDLRGNSFVDLSAEDRAAIDMHIISLKNFTILLRDNGLSCACSKFSFIAWLQRHRHHFDQDGNFTCIAEDGALSYTGSHMDLKAFWRQCHGKYYLMLSGTLACGLAAVYLAMFLVMKKKTEIISKVMRIAVPGFRLKTRRDYVYDVCIGYADQDGTYIRNVLLRYLEDMWNLRTFVHQRDLMQDPVAMSHALRDSWRCLLIVTETFLYRYNMAHNVMKVASFFVNPANPRSVVVMVEESIRHRVPDYVLQAVDEDNIIVFQKLEPILDYETKEFLRTRLT